LEFDVKKAERPTCGLDGVRRIWRWKGIDNREMALGVFERLFSISY
jgi:hypothetical protein